MDPLSSKSPGQGEGVPVPSSTAPPKQVNRRNRRTGVRVRSEASADQPPTPPTSGAPFTTPRRSARRGRGGRGNSTRGASSRSAKTKSLRNRTTPARPVSPPQAQEEDEDEDEDEDEELDVTKLSPVQQRQRQAHSALRQLRHRPHQEVPIFSQKWTPEHKEILESNVKLLLDATKDASKEPELSGLSSDDDGDEIESAAARPSGATSQRTGVRPQSNPAQGKKRRLGDEEEVSGEAAETAAIRPLKKLRFWPSSRDQPQPEDLAKLQPQPLRSQFPAHPLEDRSDQWYILEFRMLYRRMEKFVSEYFCTHDLEEGDFHQPWAINQTPEFLAYVEEVAEADPVNGSWDSLLRDTAQRKWLIMGVLVRILQKKVFDEDLWGAEIAEKNLLMAAERAFCTTSDGFHRTKLRSETVRTIVGGRPITTHFHTDVARLTAQVSLLLKPLTNYLYAIPPPEGKTTPLIWDQYQGLHNIISCAAYLSIYIRLSPTIFQFVEVSTNEPWDNEEQHDLETALYQKNKEQVIAAHETTLEAHQATKVVLDKKVADLAAAGRGGTREGRRAASRLIGHLKTQPRHLNHTHRSMAKISVWPNITRYKPGSDEEEDQNLPLDQRKGMRIFKVCKSAVVSYYGVENRVERSGKRVSLRGFAKEKNTLYGVPPKRNRRALWVVGAAAVAAIPAWILAEQLNKGLTGEDLGTTLMGLAGNLV